MTDQSLPHIQIEVPYEQIAAFCRRYHIVKLSLFGSVLRDEFDDESDVDVLVEFEEGFTPDFFSLYGIEQELSQLFEGRLVDLVTLKALNPHLRERILASMFTVYAEN